MQFKLRLKKYTNILVAVLGLAVSVAYSQTYPAPAANAGPASFSGSFPAGFAAFNPPVSGSPNAAAPEIGEWTRSNRPGDSMALTGVRLSSLTGGAAGTDSAFVFYGQSAAASATAAGSIVHLEGMHATVTLPSSLPANAIHFAWPKNANGYGEPVIINGAESWWVGPNKLSRGETFSVYGRNLVANEASPVAYAYIEETGAWLTSVAANPFKADFEVPAGLANGSYTVWVHNGLGREYGWAKSVSLSIIDSYFSWNNNQASWVNVKSAPYNAKGDGSSDDYAAIAAAIAATPDGGTIYFPAGTYLMGQSLMTIYGDKRLLGAGKDATTIKRHPGFNSGAGKYLIANSFFESEISSLTLGTGDNAGELMNIRGAGHVRFTDVRFTQQEWQGQLWEWMDIHNTKNITFKDCDFITASGIFLGGSSQLLFDGCNFYGVRDCNGMVYEKAGTDISFVNCTAQPLDSSDKTSGAGWSKGRWIVGSGGWGAMRNFYFGGNTTTDMMPREPIGEYVDQNSGEQFLFEGLATLYRGQPISATSETVRFSNLDHSNIGNIISIVGGDGIGQSRMIVAYDAGSKTVTLDEPWRVIPTSGSTLAIGHFMSRMVVYDNYFDGMERALSSAPVDYTASAGISAYGGCSDLVVANNTFHQLRTAIYNWGNGEPTANSENIVMQPNFFNLFNDNQIDSCLNGAVNVAYIDKPNMSVDPDIVLLGNVFRENTIENITGTAVITAVNNGQLMVDMCVFDQNVITNAAKDIEESSLAENQIWIEPSEEEIVSPPIPPNPEPPPTNVPLGRIEISGPVSVDEGGTAQLVGTGFYVDGSSEVLNVEWSVNSASATINSSGLFTAGDVASDEVVSVTAVYGPHSDSTDVTVSYVPPFLDHIEISGPATVLENGEASYSCVAHYSDGSVLGINPSWSDNSGSASISAAGQLVTGDVIADMNITITASFGGKTDTHTVTIQYVPPTLTALTIIGPFSVDEESSAPFTCVGSFSDGTTATVNPTWSVSSSDATINGSGTLTAGDVTSDKSVVLTASYSGVSANRSVTINFVPPYIVGVEISGLDQVAEESTAQYTCESVYSDGARETIVPVWSVLAGAASIDASGALVTGNVAGDQTATIQAAFDGKTGTFDITILYVAPTVSGLTISGPTVIEAGTTASYICTANYSDGTTGVINPAWSDDAAFANITASGVLSAGTVAADQLLAITASVGGVQAGYAVTVLYVAPPVTLSSLSINAPSFVNENSSETLVCNAIYSDGSQGAVSPVWITDSEIATIDSNGVLVTGNMDESNTITVSASYNGQVTTHVMDVLAVGNQIIYPLTGFEEKTVKARLWDETGQVWIELGQMVSPQELVVENVTAGQWYMVAVDELNNATGEWALVHTSWVSM